MVYSPRNRKNVGKGKYSSHGYILPEKRNFRSAQQTLFKKSILHRAFYLTISKFSCKFSNFCSILVQKRCIAGSTYFSLGGENYSSLLIISNCSQKYRRSSLIFSRINILFQKDLYLSHFSIFDKCFK